MWTASVLAGLVWTAGILPPLRKLPLSTAVGRGQGVGPSRAGILLEMEAMTLHIPHL